MTVKRMYLEGDPTRGFTTTPWHRIHKEVALEERDRARYVPGAINWADRTLRGIPVNDVDGHFNKIAYASLYQKENGQLMLLERF